MHRPHDNGHPGFRRNVCDQLSLLDRRGERFLDQDVNAGVGQLCRERNMKWGGRRDDRGVESGDSQRCFDT